MWTGTVFPMLSVRYAKKILYLLHSGEANPAVFTNAHLLFRQHIAITGEVLCDQTQARCTLQQLLPFRTSMRKRIRIIFAVFALVLAALVVADSVGIFDSRPYREVPHGNHSHYVPHDRDPNIPISDFPTRPPREGERITPFGEIVPDTLGEWW